MLLNVRVVIIHVSLPNAHLTLNFKQSAYTPCRAH